MGSEIDWEDDSRDGSEEAQEEPCWDPDLCLRICALRRNTTEFNDDSKLFVLE